MPHQPHHQPWEKMQYAHALPSSALVSNYPQRLMVSALVFAFNVLLPKIDFNSFSAFLNSRDRWMAQLLYNKHRPATLFLIIGAAGMVYFWTILRKAINEGSGIKTSGTIAAWVFVLYFLPLSEKGCWSAGLEYRGQC